MPHYQIHNYADGNEYVNIDSDPSDVASVWTTLVPYNYNPENGKATKPLQFTKRVDALALLHQIKRERLLDWSKNEFTYIRYGKKKPAWKIYKVVDTAE
jgi:hypothetical protein